jgi:hypothetical protein
LNKTLVDSKSDTFTTKKMRFSTVGALACLLAFGTAATIPAEIRSPTEMTEAPVEKRQLVTALVTALLTAAATEVGTIIVQDAANAAVAAINSVVTDFTTVIIFTLCFIKRKC